TVIAHGDYRLDNTVVGGDGKVRAVLDWELCTLGDPLADLGTFSAYWADRPESDDATPAPPARMLPATALPGFPRRAELAERYAKASGRDVSDLPYYVAFAMWKLACIVEGVFVRYATGAMGSDTSGAEMFARSVIDRAEAAKRALAQL
ncbi:MAG TPA: phosphotransferase, partial [Acidimicrobiales bacterium]|nr:phosphotransferase [Acidimicrobiales bacterium]